jgi:hypothetical protein
MKYLNTERSKRFMDSCFFDHGSVYHKDMVKAKQAWLLGLETSWSSFDACYKYLLFFVILLKFSTGMA